MNIRNDKTLMITSFMIILMLCCWGCYEDPLEDQGKENLRPGQLTVEKAYDLFKEYAYNMDLGTRSIGESSPKVNLDPGVITPEWDHATLSTTRVNSFVNVPILVTNKYLVKSPYNEDWINVSQKLVVVQEDVTQRYNIYVLNLIPEGEFATKNGNDISDLCQAGQMPDDFSGLAVYTKMQGGLPVYVGSYRKGELVKEVFLFDNKYSFEENLDRINSLLRGYSLQTCNIALSRSYSESGGSGSGSSGSGDGWQFHTDGGSFQHDGYTCWYSSDGKGNRYIVADTNGDGKPDTIYGNVEDVVGGGGSGGTTNPGGGTINPGGGSTNPGGGGDINPGGGGTTSGGSGGTGGQVSSKVKAETITKAAKNAVANVIKKYGAKVASCNRGVQSAFNEIYDTKELDNKRANDIVDYWEIHPEKWESIKMSEAQKLANEGWFVVAGWKAAPGKSGHVVVIVPGTEQVGWGGKVPVAMDTGANMRSESQKLSLSFGKDKKDNIKFFKYK